MNLEEWPIAWRIALTFVIVLVILFILALFGYLTGRWDAQAQPRDRTPSSYQRELLQLDKDAVKEAYKEHAKKLFNIWIADSTGQPERMVTGMRNAQQAYIGAMVEINKYEQELGR